MTFFTVIIPCFDAAETLGHTLDAIRAQTFTKWEVLCVDDGSNDSTRAIIQKYADLDPRIALETSTGRGPSRARNAIGLCWTAGEVLAFCDADDIWAPEKLAQLYECFKDQTVDAAYGQIGFFQDSPSECCTLSTVPAADLTIPMLLAENPVGTLSNLAIRASVFRDTDGFEDRMMHNEDLEWLIRLVGGGARVVGLNVLQTYYRNTPTGLSSDLAAMQTGRENAIRTALTYGHVPTKSATAIYYRDLARRALHRGQGRLQALKFSLSGMAACPKGFFLSP